MAKVPSKPSRDHRQELDGLLNNLQSWESAFSNKDKKPKPAATGKMGPTDQITRANSATVSGKQTVGRTPVSNNRSHYDATQPLSSGFLSESSIDANSEKELGNEYFKKKKYNEAIDCYSRSIALSPTAVAYANRAMAFLKVKRYQEAENDCTEALDLDDRYIKAYSRRSTARKELGKLKESVDDAEFALRIEPQNQEIKKQHTEAKTLFQKEMLKKASGALAHSMEGAQKPVKKVNTDISMQKSQPPLTKSSSVKVAEILDDHSQYARVVPAETYKENKESEMEIDQLDAHNHVETSKIRKKNVKKELNASVQELAAKAASLAKGEAAKNIVPPNTAYQFEASWRALSGDSNLQARLLKVTSPTALPVLFKNALSAPMLMDIIRCIGTFFTEDMALGIEYLQNLTKIPRFDMILMCFSSADKAELHKIWNEVFSKGTLDYEILCNLRSRYGMK